MITLRNQHICKTTLRRWRAGRLQDYRIHAHAKRSIHEITMSDILGGSAPPPPPPPPLMFIIFCAHVFYFYRAGGKNNYFHCDKCGLCLPISMEAQHTCRADASKDNCPICMEVQGCLPHVVFCLYSYVIIVGYTHIKRPRLYSSLRTSAAHVRMLMVFTVGSVISNQAMFAVE